MKLFKLLPLLAVASLSACSMYKYYSDTLFAFDSLVSFKVKAFRGYNGISISNNIYKTLEEISLIANAYDKNDNYVSIYDLNHTSEKIEISERLYDLLQTAFETQISAGYYTPFIGSLSDLWKESLAKNEVPSQERIDEELQKIHDSSVTLEQNEEGFFAQRIGEATIDLGAIAKGYALDRCLEFLNSCAMTDYIVDAGSSSILLGVNSAKSNTYKVSDPNVGTYNVNIRYLEKTIKCRECFVSTSGISEQSTKIGDVTYSHIINPETGMAIANYDEIILINDASYGNGALGDALATSLMLSSLDEIKEAETRFGVKAIVIQGNNILYQNEGLTVY